MSPPMMPSPSPCAPSACCLGVPVPLPAALQGRTRYLVALNKQVGGVYSVAIESVLLTKGAEVLIDYLFKQRYKEHKKSICGVFCPFVCLGVPCPHVDRCVYLHVTPEGYAARQLWLRPIRKVIQGRAEDLEEGGSNTPLPIPFPTVPPTSPPPPKAADASDLHLRVPMREELLRSGHVAHNPYVIPDYPVLHAARM